MWQRCGVTAVPLPHRRSEQGVPVELELKGITRRFGSLVANDRIDLSVSPGQVHALLGENGAGKTTLMNVLYGLLQPDEGEILLDGKKARFASPKDAIAAGIGMVHQHFMLVPVFTVAENVTLGMEETLPSGLLGRGAVVGQKAPSATEDELAAMMVGRNVQLKVSKDAAKPGEVVLDVEDLTVADETGRIWVNEMSFQVRAGEILGLAGVQGNGQTELCEALLGLRPAVSGHVRLNGRDLTHSTPRQRLHAGVAYIPEDRQEDGLVSAFSVVAVTFMKRYDQR